MIVTNDVEAGVVARLRAAGCVFAEDEARLLLTDAGDRQGRLDELVDRRCGGEPLEHLLGWAAFRGRRIAVDPGVFVPRRRTEFLVALAVTFAPSDAVVVELCCGSGAVSTACAVEVPGAEIHAADIDPVAVACARRNLAGLGRVHAGDLYAALPERLRGHVDLLVANAPYVPTEHLALMPAEARLHEPAISHDGGADGLDVARRVSAGASQWLAPGGRLLVETSRAQANDLAAVMTADGLATEIRSCDDLAATVVVGRRS